MPDPAPSSGPRTRVEVLKDRMSPGCHVFLDGKPIKGGSETECVELAELLMLGVQAKLEGASMIVKVK